MKGLESAHGICFHIRKVLGFVGLMGVVLCAEMAQGVSVVPIPDSTPASFSAKKLAPHLLVDPDYYCWGMSVLQWTDGTYHGYYARWPKALGFNAWLTHCEIAHAVSDRPEGPFVTTGAVVASRNPDGWDVMNAHNPCVCVAEGKIFLYYISNKLDAKTTEAWISDKANRRTIRDAQCTGVAMATTPEGPFLRAKEVVVEPHGIFKAIAVNPAVIYQDGQFVMIIKGDDAAKEGRNRIQLVGHSKKASGPFKFADTPVYDKSQTEDACLWYDSEEKLYKMVCQVLGGKNLFLFTSPDSYEWSEGSPAIFLKKAIPLDNGQEWKPRRLERPFVLLNKKGKPSMLYVSILDKGIAGNVALSLQADSETTKP